MSTFYRLVNISATLFRKGAQCLDEHNSDLLFFEDAYEDIAKIITPDVPDPTTITAHEYDIEFIKEGIGFSFSIMSEGELWQYDCLQEEIANIGEHEIFGQFKEKLLAKSREEFAKISDKNFHNGITSYAFIGCFSITYTGYGEDVDAEFEFHGFTNAAEIAHNLTIRTKAI